LIEKYQKTLSSIGHAIYSFKFTHEGHNTPVGGPGDWADLQRSCNCCGIHRHTDWIKSLQLSNPGKFYDGVIPGSCCGKLGVTECSESELDLVYRTGCLERLAEVFRKTPPKCECSPTFPGWEVYIGIALVAIVSACVEFIMRLDTQPTQGDAVRYESSLIQKFRGLQPEIVEIDLAPPEYNSAVGE
jgi:hypothetical protein